VLKTFLKTKRRGLGPIGWIMLILISVSSFYPIQADGFVKEYYTVDKTTLKKVLKKTIDCDFNLGNNKEKDWSFTSLGDNLIIEVDISSTEIIVLKTESKNGVEVNLKDNILLFNKTVEGPSLVVSINNPWDLFGEKAELQGSVKIYHEYYETVETREYNLVPGKVWTIWWMPVLFGNISMSN